MTIDSISSGQSALSASATGAATTSKASFGADFETFLQLLTAQLQNQDPLSPMDSDKFTEQLVQYSQVEQSIKTNSNLERMLDNMQADRLTSALDYVGQWVELDGDTAVLGAEGGATIGFDMPEGALSASVQVINAQGQTVARLDTETTPSVRSFTWDGIGANGQRQPAGNYRMVVDAVAAEEEILPVATRVGGHVEGVERHGDEITLIVAGNAYATSSVRSVTNRRLDS